MGGDVDGEWRAECGGSSSKDLKDLNLILFI